MVSSALLVDDDPGFLALAAWILEGMGIEVVTTVGDAAAAIAAADATKADAVLVDVGLPDRNGIDLAYELAALPWAPRVVLTSTDSDAAHAIDVRDEDHRIPFVPKNEVASASLRRLFMTE
jgi:two-component system nitrate/nitrite response regulator NarL